MASIISKNDLNTLKDITVQTLVDGLSPIIEGARGDLVAYAQSIATVAVEAAANNDQETLAQLDDQRKALIEANRLRVAEGLLDTVDKVISSVLGFAIRLAANAVIPGIGGAVAAATA